MLPAFERRSVRRFAVSYSGELASGTSVMPVVVSDVSYTGCGVESVEPPSETVGRTGVISIRGTHHNAPPLLLPVMICNQRVESGKSRIGLQFRKLSKPQVRDLLGVLEKVIQT